MNIPWFRILSVSIVLGIVLLGVYVRGMLVEDNSSPALPTFRPSLSVAPQAAYQPVNSASMSAKATRDVTAGGSIALPLDADSASSKPTTVQERALGASAAQQSDMEYISDMFFAVPAGWSYKGNYAYGLLTTADFEDSGIDAYPNPDDLSTVTQGARMNIEYVLDEVDPGIESSADFAQYMLDVFSRAPEDERMFIRPHAITVGGVPMVNLGGMLFSDHGGRVAVGGRKDGKNITITMSFAGPHVAAKKLLDEFLASFRFSN